MTLLYSYLFDLYVASICLKESMHLISGDLYCQVAEMKTDK